MTHWTRKSKRNSS